MIELKALQGQVKYLVDDLREVVAENNELRSSLEGEWKAAFAAQRTAGTFESWLEDALDQAAVAWVLGCVFVRFCEDNGLIKRVWIGGPTSVAPVERAVQERQGYLIANPTHNDRHWLREAFKYLAGLRPTGKIFDEHNPVWRFGISGRAAEALSDFFRRGDGYTSLESPGLNTRFLGDLYQNLSAHARETYALLQTPEFVEEFILDRTFEPAYREFGLAETRVIDPTCGSGHFLLGAFDRLIERWKAREPATDVRELAQRALDQVAGVDINAFAVAIARFRLMIAALKSCGLDSLESAPTFALRLATGDSLLEWGAKSRHQGDLLGFLEGESGFAYATEDADMLADILRPGQFTVVVGNPPYIAVRDGARSKVYREIYPVCHRQYQLTVPFAERFFRLARVSDDAGAGAGWVGQITSNGFMKREFGVKLINNYFAHDVELTEIIDASGAFIPGHGTPTVILVGRNNSRYRSKTVRSVLGVRGEPSEPAIPAKGHVWSAIRGQIDAPGSDSDWVTVADVDRAYFGSHPWSLSGGGASSLMSALRDASVTMIRNVIRVIGRVTHTGSDDSYFAPRGVWKRIGVQPASVVDLVEGDVVRDWHIQTVTESLFPYDSNLTASLSDERLRRTLWLTYGVLSQRREPNGTHAEIGLTWYEWSRWHPERYSIPLGIGMAFVATHNHFVLDRGGKVFNRSAPVIKLPEGATEDDHLRLLGVLNSSTACFWLKQVSHDKGSQSGTGGFMHDEWERFYEFTGTKLQEFPLPSHYPLDLARSIDELAQRFGKIAEETFSSTAVPSRQSIERAKVEWELVRSGMIAAQERLDWTVYGIYGLVDGDQDSVDEPLLQLGERAFEIVLARRVHAGRMTTVWFDRHDSKPITDLPAHWSPEYRALVERRIDLIESNRSVGLLERPQFKRRWATDGWDALRQEALRAWLLNRLEAPEIWAGAPTPLSVAQIADRVRHDEDFRSVLELWVASDQHDLLKALGSLVADEHVPYLPSLRYKPSGLRKRVQWERTWELQRQEDEGRRVHIPVPPKYVTGDFLKFSYWRNRGKLDVPKERFVSYPNAGRDGDSTLLLGWAGWDHLAQSQAIATVYLDRKTQAGWQKEALLPLLAGLAELEPWLKQWYAEPQPGFPGSPAQFFTSFIDTELATLGADRAELTRIRGLG